MASALLHGDRSQVVSRGKKPPSPLVEGSKTPTPRSSEAKKRLNSSDGSSRQLASAAKAPTSCKSATRQRPSDILNPKTVDPVSELDTVVTVLLGFCVFKILFSFTVSCYSALRVDDCKENFFSFEGSWSVYRR